jgi:DNA-binding XRE family transcriptional regulator
VCLCDFRRAAGVVCVFRDEQGFQDEIAQTRLFKSRIGRFKYCRFSGVLIFQAAMPDHWWFRDGCELRERRKKAGLTQRQVAAWLWVTQSFVAQMETGKRPIPRGFWGDRNFHEELFLLFADLDADPNDPEVHDVVDHVPAPRGPYG